MDKNKLGSVIFNKLNDFEIFCERCELLPNIEVLAKKHSNMRGDFFHLITGEINIRGAMLKFSISEPYVLKEKMNSGSYIYSDIFKVFA